MPIKKEKAFIGAGNTDKGNQIKNTVKNCNMFSTIQADYLPSVSFDHIKNSLDISSITAQATGQWENIISALSGVKLIKNKHTPCPVCGGKDRFRFDDLDGRGTYICNQCGAGDGLSLLAKTQNTSTREAANHVATFLGLNRSTYLESKQNNLSKGTSTPKDKEVYFTNKLNQTILGVSDYFKGKGIPYPALMANNTVLIPLINIKGEVKGIQSINPQGVKKYGAGDQKKGSFYVVIASQKKEDHLNFAGMLTNVSLNNPSKPEIIISEGVATAVTTKLLFPDALCIAALDSGNLLPVAKAIRGKYPKSTITIAADNDSHLEPNIGVEAAIKAAHTINGCVSIPSTDSKADWNDLYLTYLNKGTKEQLTEQEIIQQLRQQFTNSIKKESIVPAELADGTQLSHEELSCLQDMNQTYTQVILPDGSQIYSKRVDQISGFPVLRAERPKAFIARYNHQPRIAKKNAAIAWDKWAGKNIKLDGVGFYPDRTKCPDTVLNLFDGFTLQPIKGDCLLYLNHIEQVICSGDKQASQCFISWLAHMLQKPDEKPSFAVVMISNQGAGKGTTVNPLLKILGSFGVYQNGIERITGRFNSTIANKLLVFVDEVHISNPREADILKSLISEPVVSLEQKGIDPIQLPNYARFIFASNRTDAIKTGIMERRYLVLETNNQYAQDKTYFDQLWHWLNNHGAAYLLDYLLNYDLSDFDPRRAVQTNALKNQILSNLTGIDGFIYDQLASDNPFNYLANYGRIKVSELVDLYIDWAKEAGEVITQPRARRELGHFFTDVLQVNKTGRAGRGDGVIYELPDINTMIQRFAGIRLKMGSNDLF